MKYIRLYLNYAKHSLMAKLTYKANVFIGIVAFLFTQITSLLTLYLLIDQVPSLDGYTKYEIGMLFAITNLAIGIDHLFTDRLWTVAYWEVKDGKMDHFFLRPVPVLFQIIASEIQLEAFGEIIVSIVLLFICGGNINLNITFGGVIMIIVGILCASVIIACFKIMITSLAFVFKRSGALLQFVYNFSTYTKYPLKIFPKVIKYLLYFVIPLGICLFIPFDNLFNNQYNPWLVCLIMIGVTFIFTLIAGFIWCQCVKRYESTGS